MVSAEDWEHGVLIVWSDLCDAGADLHEMQLQGAHALWEFAVERVHHDLFTPGIMHAMLKTLKPGIAHLVHTVSAALW